LHYPVTWDDICNSIKESYGISERQQRSEVVAKLLHLTMKKHHTLDRLIENFEKYKRLSCITDSYILIKYFINALFPAPYKQVNESLATCTIEQRDNLTYVITTTKNLYLAFTNTSRHHENLHNNKNNNSCEAISRYSPFR
jgi:hypothetical protein